MVGVCVREEFEISQMARCLHLSVQNHCEAIPVGNCDIIAWFTNHSIVAMTDITCCG